MRWNGLNHLENNTKWTGVELCNAFLLWWTFIDPTLVWTSLCLCMCVFKQHIFGWIWIGCTAQSTIMPVLDHGDTVLHVLLLGMVFRKSLWTLGDASFLFIRQLLTSPLKPKTIYHQTRSEEFISLEPPQINTELFKLAFRFFAPHKWNKLWEVLKLDRNVLVDLALCLLDDMVVVQSSCFGWVIDAVVIYGLYLTFSTFYCSYCGSMSFQ